MNEVSSALTWAGSTPWKVAGVIFFVVGLILAVYACMRVRWTKGYVFLELIRALILLLVGLTLWQPEWRTLFEPKEKPTLAILYDDSTSMTTKDVEGEAASGAFLTRKEAIAPFLEEERWTAAGVGENLNLILTPFSSALDPPESGTDLNTGLLSLLEEHPNLRAIVLLSDGDWNLGDSPATAATQLRMAQSPVFAVPTGSESRLPDLEVAAFDPPTFGIVDKPLRVPFAIESALPRDHTTEIKLTMSSGEVLTKEVTIPAMGKVEDAISWQPKDIGEVDLTLEIPEAPKEIDLENNKRTTPVSIRKEELQVLVIESYPRWEYRYLRNALERDPGVEVSCLLVHPDIPASGGGRGYLEEFPKKEDLAEYDVIFLGDVGTNPGMLTPEQCEMIAGVVRNQASGLVFLPGFRGYQASLLETELGDLYPVQMDEAQPRGWGSPAPGTFELTELGRRSLLTKLEDSDNANARVWNTLPGFQWYAAATRAKAGTEVLAVHATDSSRFGRVPLIATRTEGAGKILFMGTDGAWRWREGVEDKYHYRFWGQVARWMAYQRNMNQGERIRLFYSPDRPRANDLITLNANAMGIGGEPLREATVIVSVVAPSGKTESVRLQSAGEDSWGLFTGRFTPTEGGTYKLEVSCSENGAVLPVEIDIQGDVLEKTGRPARPEVLEEIARLSRGEVMADGDIEKVIAAIAALPEPEPIEKNFRIWAHWIWAAALILLLAIFWIGRKIIGTI